MGAIGTRGSAALVGVAVLLVAVPVASARVEVLSPRAGATVDGAVRVQVRVGRGTVTARLNGQRADRKLVRTAGGRREVILGAAQGLRHGSNTLVLSHRQRGRPTTRQSVRFTVRARRPLAGARTRGESVAGAPVRLDARGSLPRPGRGKRLRYRWRVLRVPPGSRVRPDRAAFAAAAAAGQAPGTCGSNRGSAQTTSAGALASDQLPVETGSGGTAGAGTPQTGTTPTSTTPTTTTPTPTTPTSTTTTSTAPTPTTPTTTTSTSTTTTPATTTPSPTTPTTTSPAPVAPTPAPVSPAQTGLADVVAPATSLTPDVPGCYQLELIASDQTAASSPDVVTVQASPPTPLVAIDTGAKQGLEYGIQVGDAFYPDASQITYPRLQIVVLDRRTLAPVAFGGQSPGDKNAGNKIYGGDIDASAAQISKDLKPLQDDVLVIASNPPGFAYVARIMIDGLASIGVDPSDLLDPPPNTFGAVGIPGLPTGEARTSVNAALETTPGLKGVLVKDQFDSYKLVSTHYVDLDTRAAGGGATSNVMQIGTQKYSAKLRAGATGGFHVVVLSGFDLSLKFNDTIDTAPALLSDVTAELNAVSNAIDDAVPPNSGVRLVVLVTSIGSPADARNAIADQWNDLSSFIGYEAGGSQDAIQNYQPGQSYSLAGAATLGQIGQDVGTEVGSMIDSGSTGRITGVLARDANWQFAASGGELGAPPPSLMGVIYQQATPWPAYNPAAMQYIAKQVGLGSDVRVNYWTQPYSETVWQQYQGAIQRLEYPGDGKGFSRSDFTSLQTELVTEIGWLIKAKDFLTGTGGLSQPFTDNGLKNWAELKAIANTIDDGVQPPPKASAFLEAFLGVLGDMFDIASLGVGEAFAPAFELMGSTLAAGSDIASYGESGESANDRYTTTVDNYGVAFTTRMTDIQSAYRRLFDIAASDWAKLCTLGTRQRCDPQSGGPSGPQLWQWTQDDQDQASLGLQQWSRRDIWRALLPAKFPLSFLQASNWWQTMRQHENAFPWSQASVYSLPNLDCGDGKPLKDLPDSAQAKLSSETTATGSGYELWMIGKNQMLPEASITDPLWQPPDPGGDPFKGGLGFHPYHFLFRAWPQSNDYVNLDSSFGGPACAFPPSVPVTPAPPEGSNRQPSRSRAHSSKTPNRSGAPDAKPKTRPNG